GASVLRGPWPSSGRTSSAWRDDYNHHRPHTSLDGLMPRESFNRSEKDQTRKGLNF
ncbi:integrase core domain-containing protein, partial [Rhodosalinus sp. FB01]|uniref:integrase core domain-containing protein n=1 Tax=Rhodosalinus sp. FB01 TaxID=3239194 RepID=UPI0035242BE3